MISKGFTKINEIHKILYFQHVAILHAIALLRGEGLAI